MNPQFIKECGREERIHREFFLPYYRANNLTVVEDWVGKERSTPYDVLLEDRGGKRFRVDEKAYKPRESNWPEFCVELVQHIGEPEKKSWLYDHRKDYYLVCRTKTEDPLEIKFFHFVNHPKLFAYLMKPEAWKHRNVKVSVRGYGITLFAYFLMEKLEKEGIARPISWRP